MSLFLFINYKLSNLLIKLEFYYEISLFFESIKILSSSYTSESTYFYFQSHHLFFYFEFFWAGVAAFAGSAGPTALIVDFTDSSSSDYIESSIILKLPLGG